MGFLGNAAGVLAAVFLATAAQAQTPAPAGTATPEAAVGQQRLDVVPNADAVEAEGVLSGFATARFVVSAGVGQNLAVSLDADNPQAVFNVLAPGAATPLFNGARKGRAFDQALTATGDYTVEVYLARAAARRSEAASYTLSVAVTGSEAPEAAAGPARSRPAVADDLAGGPDYWEVANVAEGGTLAVRAEAGTGAAVVAEVAAGTLLANGGCRVVAGERWCQVTGRDDPAVAGWAPGRNLREAVGVAAPEAALPAASDTPAPALAASEVACAGAPEEPLAACGFTIDRAEDGAIALRVTLPSGATRVIRFVNGEPVTSDGTGAFTASRGGETLTVRIGDERYEIPEAAVRGG